MNPAPPVTSTLMPRSSSGRSSLGSGGEEAVGADHTSTHRRRRFHVGAVEHDRIHDVGAGTDGRIGADHGVVDVRPGTDRDPGTEQDGGLDAGIAGDRHRTCVHTPGSRSVAPGTGEDPMQPARRSVWACRYFSGVPMSIQ